MSNIQLFTLFFITPIFAIFIIFRKEVGAFFCKKYVIQTYLVIVLLYLIAVRYIPTWLIAGGINLSTNNYKGYKIQNIFLTDFCPMFGLLIPLCVLTNNKFLARSLSPIGIVAGMVTMYGFFATHKENVNNLMLSVTFNFEGFYGYYPLHFVEILNSIIILATYPERSWKENATGFISIIVFSLYVLAIKNIFGLQRNVSGLSINDWKEKGEYYSVALMLKLSPKADLIIWVFTCSGFYWIACGVLTAGYMNARVLFLFKTLFNKIKVVLFFAKTKIARNNNDFLEKKV